MEGVILAAGGAMAEAQARRFASLAPRAICVLAHTDTCLLPGVSAAGATEALRALTPAADAEAVALGAPRCLPELPANPLGPPGPAGITRAVVELTGLSVEFVAAGLPVMPSVPVREIPCARGGSIDREPGVPSAERLLTEGRALGREIARPGEYLLLAESVPGGTTTALALLRALGYDADGRVSGSLRGNGHALKTAVATAALERAGLGRAPRRTLPVQAVREVGDPMQPLAAGIALGALERSQPVLLAGGSQMLAVAALMRALGGSAALDGVAVGTTRWVAADPLADVVGLARDIDRRLALLAADLDFSTSRFPPLRAYEQGLVKEGVGAGGAALAAFLSFGVSRDTLHDAIDRVYARLAERRPPVSASDRGRCPPLQFSEEWPFVPSSS